MFNIVLLEPEIPANTGNIGRTCLVTGSRLHLIEPLGFILNDKNLKRAGLDYWEELDCFIYDGLEDFSTRHEGLLSKKELSGYYRSRFSPDYKKAEFDTSVANEQHDPDKKCLSENKIWYASTKAEQTYADVSFTDGDYIMFGKESAGIPEELLIEAPEKCIRIPMIDEQRSLNLSNSVAVILYEALRQTDFKGLKERGKLHRFNWKNN